MTEKTMLRHRLHEIIFEADTPAGKAFDVVLIVSILLSVVLVMLDSVEAVQTLYGPWLYAGEWLFTVLFTVEYLLRLYCVQRPLLYARSFFGLVDLLAILPTYLSVILPGGQYFIIIRVLRLLRIFRVFKLAQFLSEARLLLEALKASLRKIAVFLSTVLTLVMIFGALMYVVEGADNGFTSIPRSIYWAIVTMTTVGYGDISPQTGLGQALAALIMIIGYGIIAVPTGIVTVELSQAVRRGVSTQACPRCGQDGHDQDAGFCKYCGAPL
jgi:voltage-gated potassium channel